MSTHCDFLCRADNHSASCRAVASGIAWYKMFGSKRLQAASVAAASLPTSPPLLTRGESTVGLTFNQSTANVPAQSTSSAAARVAGLSTEGDLHALLLEFHSRLVQLSDRMDAAESVLLDDELDHSSDEDYEEGARSDTETLPDDESE